MKTEAGRLEMQTRRLVKERARRNLLLLIDGIKSEEMLLSGVAGISAEDFRVLRGLSLIAPVALPPPPVAPVATPDAAIAEPLDYTRFTAVLTQLISNHLGLRGFVLTLALEKAGTPDELQAVAQRVLQQIRERRGDAAAELAKQTLYGA